MMRITLGIKIIFLLSGLLLISGSYADELTDITSNNQQSNQSSQMNNLSAPTTLICGGVNTIKIMGQDPCGPTSLVKPTVEGQILVNGVAQPLNLPNKESNDAKCNVQDKHSIASGWNGTAMWFNPKTKEVFCLYTVNGGRVDLQLISAPMITAACKYTQGDMYQWGEGFACKGDCKLVCP